LGEILRPALWWPMKLAMLTEKSGNNEEKQQGV